MKTENATTEVRIRGVSLGTRQVVRQGPREECSHFTDVVKV